LFATLWSAHVATVYFPVDVCVKNEPGKTNSRLTPPGAPFSFHGELTPRMKTHETRVGCRHKNRLTSPSAASTQGVSFDRTCQTRSRKLFRK